MLGAVVLLLVALNAPFLQPRRDMDQQVVKKTPYRQKHAARCRVNEVEKAWTDDQHTLGMTESLRHEPGNILNHGQSADGDIKSFLNHIDGPVRRLDEHRNLWMHRHIAGKQVSETPLRQQYRAAEPNESRRFPAQFRNAIEGRLCSFDCRDTSLKEALSGFSQSQSTGGALEQTDTEPLLQ